MYSYFVSYSFTMPNPKGMGFGSQQVDYDRPVRRFADVEVLTQKVHERLLSLGHAVPAGAIVVLNFVLLSGPEEDDI
ncbi:hypothetical protein [Micromonospora aurantiaca (nom. illeg.)]|uniref:hypothetical protein n=1 Tax=Micromonospora aurantiaca (nom. illeg.) TaxID=47850 RepID=UPI003EC08288